jgi:hypothetical protein
VQRFRDDLLVQHEMKYLSRDNYFGDADKCQADGCWFRKEDITDGSIDRPFVHTSDLTIARVFMKALHGDAEKAEQYPEQYVNKLVNGLQHETRCDNREGMALWCDDRSLGFLVQMDAAAVDSLKPDWGKDVTTMLARVEGGKPGAARCVCVL